MKRLQRLIARALPVAGCIVLLVTGLSSPAQQSDRPEGWSEATHTNRANPDYDRLFAMDRVHELRITIAAEDFAAMQRDLGSIQSGGMGFGRRGPRADRLPPDMFAADPMYVPVTVTHDGRDWPGVGMRYKGNSSLSDAIRTGNGKVPFRLDFDRYEDEFPGTSNQRFYGFEKLTFSSNYSDDSMLKEVLVTELFRDFGVPAARAAFCRVFVDTGDGPEYWGLYSMIEDPADGAMLDAQFGSHSGNLYKPNGPGSNWMYFDEEGFERKNNDSADYSDVLAALEALHAAKTEPKRWRRALEAVFDVDDFLHWLAMNTAMSNWDAYGRMAHNYYLYGDPAEDGRLNWIPWDHNMAFGIRGGGLPDMRDMRGGRSVGLPLEVMAMPGDDILHTEAGDSWPLISRLLEDDVYAARYRKLLAQTFDGLLAPAAFEARAAELHALIAPYVVGEFGERRTHTTLRSQANFENSVVALVRFAASRQDQVRDALASD